MKRLSLLVLIALSGCNETGFTPSKASSLAQSNPTPTPTCKITIGSSNKDIRILFMLDNSGSTNQTDPSQAIRVQTIQKFNADYGGKSNLTYYLGYFMGTTASMFNMLDARFENGLASNAIGNSAQLTTALTAYDAVPPNGNTPYKAAFNSIEGTIKADIATGAKQDYVVVFMSDGQPTDIASPVTTNLNSLVNSLKSVASGASAGLSLSTVYFGPATDTTSISNLQGMATLGGGQFVDTNKLAAGGLVINDIINIPGTCQ